MQGSPVWLLALAWSGRPACLHPRGNDHLECGDFVAAFFLPSLRPPRLAASPLECGDSSPPSFFPSLRAPHPAASPLECGDLSPLSFVLPSARHALPRALWSAATRRRLPFSLPSARHTLPRALWSAATCRRLPFSLPPARIISPRTGLGRRQATVRSPHAKIRILFSRATCGSWLRSYRRASERARRAACCHRRVRWRSR